MFRPRLYLLTILIFTLVGIPAPTTAQEDIPWPTNGWLTSTPEEQGVDSAQLLALLEEIERQAITLDSLLVIRHGYIVMDAYFWPFERGIKHNLYSATKSFTSALVGVAMQQGFITSVDQPVLELLPSYTPTDPRWSEITLRDTLTMSTGADCTADPLWHDTDDWTQDILDLSITYEPGNNWQYCNYSPQLLSSIVGRATGTPSADFARENLLKPLRITDYDWPKDPQGNVLGPTDLMLTPHDMAKLGYLYLHEGRWEDQQIIPAAYVRESACMVDDASYCQRGSWNGWRYGYQWWVPPTDPYSFQAQGHVDQLITVMPDRDLVIVVTAHGVRDGATDGLNTLVANSVAQAAVSEGALPRDIETHARLESRLLKLARMPDSGEVIPLPDVTRTFSGSSLTLDPPIDFALEYWHFLYPRWNPDERPAELQQVRAMSIRAGQEASQLTLELEFADRYRVEMVVGMDGVDRTTASRFGVLAAQGGWRFGGGNTTLVIDIHIVGDGRVNKLYLNLDREPIPVVSYSVTASWATPLSAMAHQ